MVTTRLSQPQFHLPVRYRRVGAAALCAASLLMQPAVAQEAHQHDAGAHEEHQHAAGAHEEHQHAAGAHEEHQHAAGGHEAHQHAAVDAGLTRSEHAYTLPALKVTRADGKRMALNEALDDGRPVLLNFIYTSCTAICPVTSQVFADFRGRLGADRDKINMVSISIDPEQDTPARLTEYQQRFGGAGTWAHFTSASADSVEIQRAFGAWRGDKMNHQPSTYLRPAPGKPWIRLDGFYSPSALLAEYQKAVRSTVAKSSAPV